jgi:hypothetical protein
MGWEQNYVVPSVESLMEKLVGRASFLLLTEALAKQGIEIITISKIKLQEDDYGAGVEGYRIELSNGKVYIPKLVKQYTANGNYGCDYYEWKEEKEKVKVVQESDGER